MQVAARVETSKEREETEGMVEEERKHQVEVSKSEHFFFLPVLPPHLSIRL